MLKLLFVLVFLLVGAINVGAMPKQVADSVVREWELFYWQVFGKVVDLSQVKVADNSASKLGFVQYMIKGLDYRTVHEQEKKMSFGCLSPSTYLDYDTNWTDKVDMAFEQRWTSESYAIWHSGLLRESDTTYDKQTVTWLWSQRIKFMTRLEGGIFNLFINWKYKPPIFKLMSVTCWAGSRVLGFNSAQPCVSLEERQEFHKRGVLELGSVLFTGYSEYLECIFLSSGCCPEVVMGVVMRPRLVISLK
ncbi:MAG TPA: hypothetical protein PLJ58_02190 [bacterium]|nr:hypothetical protein [bacterium]